MRPDFSRERVAERRFSKGIAKTKEEALRSYDESGGQNNDFIAECRYHTDVIIERIKEMGLVVEKGKELV